MIVAVPPQAIGGELTMSAWRNEAPTATTWTSSVADARGSTAHTLPWSMISCLTVPPTGIRGRPVSWN